ncbi:MAG: hypothetical protein IPJ81_17370 [Chitinophagaceae bacterium]|nr:hypothetical protein [Chitinophagaceae bacterium]
MITANLFYTQKKSLRNQGINIDLYNLFKKNILTLISSHHDTTLNFLKEVYLASREGDIIKDTLVLYFSNKVKDISYTFSRELDSIKNLKLYKIEVGNGEKYIKEKRIILPKMKSVIEFKQINIINPKDILYRFERFEKDKIKNDL